MSNVQIKRTADGRTLARRKDGQPLTPEDREEVRVLARGEEPMREDDPILSSDQWYPHFREFHHGVIADTYSGYLWAKENRPDLYRAIKSKESELDALGEARLSTVMGIMTEWRQLVFTAETERKKAAV